MTGIYNLFGLLVAIIFCGQVRAQVIFPSDKKATKETVALYNNLGKLMQKGFMFGHQDDLAYGVHWKYEKGRSDIKDVTGDYPAVYGWELGHLEIDQPLNLDSVPFAGMQQLIQQGYERGGVITISWHLNNPLTGKTAWDPAAGTVASILPGGVRHDLFKTWLDKVAVFLNGLRGSKGEFIPVLFRPFHELNGNWFWWGGKNCTNEEFKALWIFTVKYLQNEKNLHHLLYAYNTDRFSSLEEYLAKYPGDEWVDVIGFDIYQRNSSNEVFLKDIGSMLSMLETISQEKSKIPALTEFGGNLSDSNWWTGTFLKALDGHKISYVLGWRNAGQKANGEFEYYVPYKGNRTEKDFIKFSRNKKTLFQKDISKKNLYRLVK
ncbi:MAG: glycosyl hydrolase [Chitinophagaceae bacterium]